MRYLEAFWWECRIVCLLVGQVAGGLRRACGREGLACWLVGQALAVLRQ